MLQSDSQRLRTWEGQRLQQNFQIKYPQGPNSKLSSTSPQTLQIPSSPCARRKLTFNYNNFQFGWLSFTDVVFWEKRKIDWFLTVFAKSDTWALLQKMTCPERDPTSQKSSERRTDSLFLTLNCFKRWNEAEWCYCPHASWTVPLRSSC